MKWRNSIGYSSSVDASRPALSAPLPTRGGLRSSFLFLLLSLAVFPPGAASAGVELVGRFDGRQEYQDVWGYDAPDGTALALLGTVVGDLIVDVTDPTLPVEVTLFEGTPCNWRDLKTGGAYAYGVNDCSSDDCLRIYDLTDPLVPRQVYSSSEFFRRAHNIYIDGDRLYAVGTLRGLVVLDISDPANPMELGVLEEPNLHDIYVRDGIGYGASFDERMLILFDVTDPTDISVLSSQPYADAATHNTWLTDDGQFCVTTDEVTAGHLRVFDVADSTSPFEVSEFINPRDPESIVHNVQIRDDLAYTSWYTSGLLVVSLQTPSFPQEVGSFDTHPATGASFDGAWGAYPFTESGLIYVSDRQTGLYVLRYTPSHGDWTFAVNRADTGKPLDDVRIYFPATGFEATTAGGLTPPLLLQEGEHAYEASLFGFVTATGTVDAVANEVNRRDIDLVPLPSGRVAGRVEAEGAVLDRASVSIIGTPLQVRPDAEGRFEFVSVPVGAYRVRTELFGFGRDDVEVEVTALASSLAQPQLLPALLAEDFESESGWTVGSPTDDATEGIWVRVNPNGTGRPSDRVQPEDDASLFGEFAFVTGNAKPGASIGQNDVDGGVTTLFSPVHDLSGAENPILQFRRWFYSSGVPDAGDFLEVAGSTDGGRNWILLSRVDASEGVWKRVEVPLRLYLGDLTTVQLRVTAQDGGLATVVEAGIDDLEVFDAGKGAIPDPGDGHGTETVQILNPRPHPMGDESILRFQTPVSTPARLDLYDVSGRRVRSIGDVILPAGASGLPFDARDDQDLRLGSGVYILRMETPDGTRSRSVRILR